MNNADENVSMKELWAVTRFAVTLIVSLAVMYWFFNEALKTF